MAEKAQAAGSIKILSAAGGYVFIFVLFMIFYVFSAASGVGSRTGELTEERESIYEFVGQKNFAHLDAMTSKLFRSIFVDTYIMKVSYDMFVVSDQSLKNNKVKKDDVLRKAFSKTESVLDIFWEGMYMAIQRAVLFMEIMPLLVIGAVTLGYDGWKIRAVKKETYGSTSPKRFHLALTIAILITAGLPFIFVLPFQFPLMAYYGIALAYMACSWVATSNFIKNF